MAGCGDDTGPRYVIIDDDNGMAFDRVREEGSYTHPQATFTDPDGGLEILYALGEPEIEVLGLTCLMGTASVDICMEADQTLLELAGRTDIPCLRGAADPTELGQESDAARFIIETVRGHPGGVEIIASGPMTNIATAIMLDPELPEMWKTLHILSGEFGLGSNIEKTKELTGGDLNLSVDFPAAEYVFTNAGPCPVYPNSLMDDVLIGAADMDLLDKAGTPLAEHVHYQVAYWFDLISIFMDQDGFWPHGMNGIAAALHKRHRGPGTRSAIRLRSEDEPAGKYYWGSIVSDMVDDPALPVHTIYFELLNTNDYRQNYRERLGI